MTGVKTNFKCKHCGRVVSSKVGILNHIVKVHLGVPTREGGETVAKMRKQLKWDKDWVNTMDPVTDSERCYGRRRKKEDLLHSERKAKIMLTEQQQEEFLTSCAIMLDFSISDAKRRYGSGKLSRKVREIIESSLWNGVGAAVLFMHEAKGISSKELHAFCTNPDLLKKVKDRLVKKGRGGYKMSAKVVPDEVQLITAGVWAKLRRVRKCKNSVVFKPSEEDSVSRGVCTGFYLMNPGFEKLGEPEKVTLTVCVED